MICPGEISHDEIKYFHLDIIAALIFFHNIYFKQIYLPHKRISSTKLETMEIYDVFCIPSYKILRSG